MAALPKKKVTILFPRLENSGKQTVVQLSVCRISPVTVEVLWEICHGIGNNKALGFDHIPYRVWKLAVRTKLELLGVYLKE